MISTTQSNILFFISKSTWRKIGIGKKKQIKTSPCEHKTSPKEKKEIFFFGKKQTMCGKKYTTDQQKKKNKKKNNRPN